MKDVCRGAACCALFAPQSRQGRGITRLKGPLVALAIALVMVSSSSQGAHALMAQNPLAAAQQSSCRTFTETGKTICGKFLAYWQSHGGLVQQGYPISGEFREVSEINGKTYTVQYFERA